MGVGHLSRDSHDSSTSPESLPTAIVEQKSGLQRTVLLPFLSVWIVAVMALIVAVGAFTAALAGRGPEIQVRFREGYGIKSGDTVRHRGIDVGEVTGVRLSRDFRGVDVSIRLAAHAGALAREGSRFWIQRPKLGLGAISGLDTIVGAKYIEALPGPVDARVQTEFVGLESPLMLSGDDEVYVTVRFADGYGIDVGSKIKHRGIDIGEITSLTVDDDLRGIVSGVRLVRSGALFARQGTQFWIERPDVSLTAVRGLDTIVGGPYVAVRPGARDAQACYDFEGLHAAPVVLDADEGIEFVLVSSERRSLEHGAPVMYRGLQIGRILSVGLSHDARHVEARLFVEHSFVELLRTNTRFWSYGGMDVSLGLTGINLNVDNLVTIAAGGVALATPDPPGDPIHTGHRFELLAEPPSNWQDWSPRIAVGSSLLSSKVALPRLQRASLAWRVKRLGIPRSQRRVGWLLPLDNGTWVMPAHLAKPAAEAVEGSCMLEFAGVNIPVSDWDTQGPLVMRAIPQGFEPEIATWAVADIRFSGSPEELVLYTGPQEPQLVIPADRMQDAGGVWLVEPSIPLDESWDGAAAIAREDSKLIGILVMEENRPGIVPLAPLLLHVRGQAYCLRDRHIVECDMCRNRP